MAVYLNERQRTALQGAEIPSFLQALVDGMAVNESQRQRAVLHGADTREMRLISITCKEGYIHVKADQRRVISDIFATTGSLMLLPIRSLSLPSAHHLFMRAVRLYVEVCENGRTVCVARRELEAKPL